MFRVVSQTSLPESPSPSPCSSSPAVFCQAEEFYRQINKDLRSNYADSKDPQYLDHFKNSRAHILAAANNLGKPLSGTVVILGSGNGNDLPPELIDQFDKVILVEIDRIASEILLENLSPSRQKKVTVVTGDLTGCLVEFMKRFHIILRASATSEDFIHRFNLLCDEMVAYLSKKKDSLVELVEPASFVVSSGVVTQLHQELLAMFSELYSGKFFKKFPLESTERSFLAVKTKIEENHLTFIRSLMQEDGHAYIADIDEERRVYPRLMSNFSSHITFKSELFCYHLTDHFRKSIAAHFSIGSEASWSFRLSEPTAQLVRSRSSPTFVDSIRAYHGTTGQVLALTLVPIKA